MYRFIAILICPEELEDLGEDAEVIPDRFEGSKDVNRYRFLFWWVFHIDDDLGLMALCLWDQV